MFPDLFGVPGLTMSLLVVLGVLVAVTIIVLYLRKFINSKVNYIDLVIVFIVTLISALIFSVLVENLYESIKNAVYGSPQSWTWSQTFYGGVFGGVIAFVLMYKFFYLKSNENILGELLIVAPAAISLGHAIGRIGCFFNGCCYGIETDKWYGILFPDHLHKVIPTQLLEAGFLFILGIVLLVLAFKKRSKYNLPIYFLSYGLFRFLIEFIRGDERGQLRFLSPSQYWSIILIAAGIALIVFYIRNSKKVIEKWNYL